jgi:hypothetical protein
MSYKKFAAIIALFALLLPACQRSLDTGQPVAPTSIYAGDSISTQGDPMAQIAQTATAMMQTPTADGAPSATPESENGTPDAEATATETLTTWSLEEVGENFTPAGLGEADQPGDPGNEVPAGG